MTRFTIVYGCSNLVRQFLNQAYLFSHSRHLSLPVIIQYSSIHPFSLHIRSRIHIIPVNDGVAVHNLAPSRSFAGRHMQANQ
jgi:hypothetical protein